MPHPLARYALLGAPLVAGATLMVAAPRSNAWLDRLPAMVAVAAAAVVARLGASLDPRLTGALAALAGGAAAVGGVRAGAAGLKAAMLTGTKSDAGDGEVVRWAAKVGAAVGGAGASYVAFVAAALVFALAGPGPLAWAALGAAMATMHMGGGAFSPPLPADDASTPSWRLLLRLGPLHAVTGLGAMAAAVHGGAGPLVAALVALAAPAAYLAPRLAGVPPPDAGEGADPTGVPRALLRVAAVATAGLVLVADLLSKGLDLPSTQEATFPEHGLGAAAAAGLGAGLLNALAAPWPLSPERAARGQALVRLGAAARPVRLVLAPAAGIAAYAVAGPAGVAVAAVAAHALAGIVLAIGGAGAALVTRDADDPAVAGSAPPAPAAEPAAPSPTEPVAPPAAPAVASPTVAPVASAEPALVAARSTSLAALILTLAALTLAVLAARGVAIPARLPTGADPAVGLALGAAALLVGVGRVLGGLRPDVAAPLVGVLALLLALAPPPAKPAALPDEPGIGVTIRPAPSTTPEPPAPGGR